jgi:hypothetical protein
MANLHQVVVDDDGEVVGREAVALEGYEIIELGGLKLHPTFYGVVPDHDLGLGRDLKAQNMGLVGALEVLQTVAIVLKGHAGFLRIFAQTVEAFGTTPTGVEIALGYQLIGMLSVDLKALRLDIGAILPFLASVRHNSLVGVDPEPVETLADRVGRLLHKALAVGVLKAQDEAPAIVFGDEIIKEGRADGPEVEETGWTGGKADAYGV